MRVSLLFIILAVVLFLIPGLLILLDENPSDRLQTLCLFFGLSSFAAGHLPV